MLVELSTQFDSEKLSEVIERLTDILEAVKASRNDDKSSEIKSRVNLKKKKKPENYSYNKQIIFSSIN